MKTKPIVIVIALLGLAVVVAPRQRAAAQQQPAALTVAMYAPSANFKDAAERSAYVQGLAKAIQTKTGIPTTGKAYARLSDLKSAKPDFAIIEGQCVAAGSYGTVLATASINGATSQSWALFTRGDNFAALKGKKLVFMDTGCNDVAFMDNAMLEGEAKVKSHFASTVGKPDAAGAVATVRDYKQADAVFAPIGTVSKGLTQVFATGSVPNPAFVQMNRNLSATLQGNVQSAVTSYSINSAIDGWKGAVSYQGLSGNMVARTKRPILAKPTRVGMQDQDVLVQPKSTYSQTGITQHFWKPQQQ